MREDLRREREINEENERGRQGSEGTYGGNGIMKEEIQLEKFQASKLRVRMNAGGEGGKGIKLE